MCFYVGGCMKIAISQPMYGRSVEQIKAERQPLIKKLEELGMSVIDTVLDIEEQKDPMYYLGESVKLFADADAVVFMPD